MAERAAAAKAVAELGARGLLPVIPSQGRVLHRGPTPADRNAAGGGWETWLRATGELSPHPEPSGWPQ